MVDKLGSDPHFRYRSLESSSVLPSQSPSTVLPRIRGIVPPMVTPLKGQDGLDHPGLERLISNQIEAGVAGLFVLGTTGEGPSLSYRLRYELVERTCELVAGRIPVLVGVLTRRSKKRWNCRDSTRESAHEPSLQHHLTTSRSGRLKLAISFSGSLNSRHCHCSSTTCRRV